MTNDKHLSPKQKKQAKKARKKAKKLQFREDVANGLKEPKVKRKKPKVIIERKVYGKAVRLTKEEKIKKCSSNQNLKERSLNECQVMIKIKTKSK